jgi:CRISPR-associated protein Cmx8
MLKAGNNIKLMAFDRVPNRTDLISKYERIRKTFRSPLFRASRLRSLLRGLPWYGGLLELYSERPWPFFIEGTETPKYLPRFGKDARLQFRGITEDTFDMKPEEMDDEQRLSRIIQRLVNRYIEGRAASKAGRKIDDFPVETIDGKKRRDFPPDVREAQRKVCSDAFLAMRSRHDQDFVEYFVGSICSVPQVLSNLDYQFLTTILLRRTQRNAIGPVQPSWEDVKALAMTAVSAYASRVQPRETSASTPEGSQSA